MAPNASMQANQGLVPCDAIPCRCTNRMGRAAEYDAARRGSGRMVGWARGQGTQKSKPCELQRRFDPGPLK